MLHVLIVGNNTFEKRNKFLLCKKKTVKKKFLLVGSRYNCLLTSFFVLQTSEFNVYKVYSDGCF